MDEENEQDGYQPNFTEAATSPAMPPQPPQPPPAMAQQQQQPPPVPMWTAADDMRFARKSAGMNQVRDDLDAGVLHPQFAMPLLQQYQNDLQGMSQEKMAFDQHQQQTATQTALANAGMQRAVEQANQQHSANGFLGTMRTFVDPVSGRDAHFYQAEPGKWEQVNFRHTDPTPGGDAGVADGGEGGGESGGEEQSPPAAEGPPAAQSPFTQTIWNGANRTDTTWQPGQTVGQSSGSWMGIPGAQPPPQANAGDSFGLTDDKKREIQNLAAVNSSHLPPGIQRNSLYSHLVQRLTSQAIAEQGQQRRMAAAATAKQGQADSKEFNDLLTNAHKEIADDHKAATKEGGTSPYPTAASRIQAANDLANEQWAARHPDSDRAKKWLAAQNGGQPGSGAKVQPPAAAAPSTPNMLRVAEAAGMTKHDALKAYNDTLEKVKADSSKIDGEVEDPEHPGIMWHGQWNSVPERVQKAEAIKRVARDVEQLTGKSILPKPAPPPGPPPITPQQKSAIDARRKQLSLAPAAPGEAERTAADRKVAGEVATQQQTPVPLGTTSHRAAGQQVQDEGKRLRQLLGLE